MPPPNSVTSPAVPSFPMDNRTSSINFHFPWLAGAIAPVSDSHELGVTSVRSQQSTAYTKSTAPPGLKWLCPATKCKRLFTRQGDLMNHLKAKHEDSALDLFLENRNAYLRPKGDGGLSGRGTHQNSQIGAAELENTYLTSVQFPITSTSNLHTAAQNVVVIPSYADTCMFDITNGVGLAMPIAMPSPNNIYSVDRVEWAMQTVVPDLDDNQLADRVGWAMPLVVADHVDIQVVGNTQFRPGHWV
ncbi:hypothetical protein HRR83_007954 [Exophiala dermatitidis]|uniref:C2H2-type domain-containing protein n=2 Tax=Exophiala dermatitidis TaxID=5970 RepID=H6BUQ0_EXODN|nr:uncharacterized protein HMPREF1120_03861 [Exophiala dermatitidis NIH/UT8656]KAJ4508801.1 hypothetical protein HRR74_007392 [Exophiala dermatitidis]EHY55737.1 hypothetical protein HMPREF1120_03861 [Exophiala dermatitidis NIH/UT8656]KAJ4510053.1 hypothetical protein HRR73_006850 [Exophiala dermatitidis]KAJ4539055.1 hypothetical protein HRR77_006471 [Exophiala dermatitidis]KAJ4540664.1 hypothetical protein HRR76_004052 [Exophiala dermatitidis]